MNARLKKFPGMSRHAECGSVFIIVLWIAFGLVAVTLYFANSMALELRAADNRAASTEAEEAIEGAANYLTMILSNTPSGSMPDPQTYRAEAVPVGDAMFWIIGRDTNNPTTGPTQLSFGLVDESSKLNLNRATVEMLRSLPPLSSATDTDLAANIFSWRSSTNRNTSGGAGSEIYSLLQPAYSAKNSNFESIDELRLVYGMNLNLLYGEDVNLNGVLDANEDDAEALPPTDNRDGKLDSGLLDYVTVYSYETRYTTNSTRRSRVNSSGQLQQLLQTTLGKRFQQVSAVDSILRLYVNLVKNEKVLTDAEFQQIEPNLRATNRVGLVNVNTASVAVLACIPGIGTNNAVTLVTYRQANPGRLNSISWVAEALASDLQNALKAGPYITVHSYQFTADIAAVGRFGRGFRRVKFIFDTSGNSPRIAYRQDLTHLGWALGKDVRNQFSGTGISPVRLSDRNSPIEKHGRDTRATNQFLLAKNQ